MYSVSSRTEKLLYDDATRPYHQNCCGISCGIPNCYCPHSNQSTQKPLFPPPILHNLRYDVLFNADSLDFLKPPNKASNISVENNSKLQSRHPQQVNVASFPSKKVSDSSKKSSASDTPTKSKTSFDSLRSFVAGSIGESDSETRRKSQSGSATSEATRTEKARFQFRKRSSKKRHDSKIYSCTPRSDSILATENIDICNSDDLENSDATRFSHSVHVTVESSATPSVSVVSDTSTLECSSEIYSGRPFKKSSAMHSLSKKLGKFRRRTLSLPSTAIQNLYSNVYSSGEKTSFFGSNYLNREWEIVTVKEVCRRLSLDRLDQLVLPLPEGSTDSQILDKAMIRQLMEILPARAEGYPWECIYSSEKHGFSLSTMYRRMIDWNEEMSPILLIIRDFKDNIFGAIVSTALQPSDHFYGTGDSCLLFKFSSIDEKTGEKNLHMYPWSGDNQFFVKASKDSVSIGAGGGHYGLWLDADLIHGRSQRCETFNNEPLSDESEDFDIQFVEAFGFRVN